MLNGNNIFNLYQIIQKYKHISIFYWDIPNNIDFEECIEYFDFITVSSIDTHKYLQDLYPSVYSFYTPNILHAYKYFTTKSSILLII